MSLTTSIREGAARLSLIIWVSVVTAIVVVPLLILSVVYVVLDILLEIATVLLPKVKMRNMRSVFGKNRTPGAYLYKWFNWIATNFNVIFSGAPSRGKWIPPIAG